MPQDNESVKHVAIVGLPNTGKSQVFYNLTKQYTLVSNYPMTTVEMKTARCKIDRQMYDITDTPGFHCLYIHSEEELAVRNMLLSEKPDVIIQCVDSNRLKQSLTLTSDLLELGIPMVISLNAVDETTRKGIWVNAKKLSRLLGFDVIESVTTEGLGNEDLKRAISNTTKNNVSLHYGALIEEGVLAIISKFPQGIPYKRKLALLLLLNDPFLLEEIRNNYGETLAQSLTEEIQKIKKKFRGNLSILINDKRSQWVTDVFNKVVKKKQLTLGGFSQTFAQLCRHPFFGLPILAGIIACMFFLVVNIANSIAGLMDGLLWAPVKSQINQLVTVPFWNDFLIGDYGILSLGFANALITVLPILSVFFLLFNFLEDVGYIPNVTVLTKRVLNKIGLSGNAIMPLVLGFGCKTMATLTTRSLRSKRERYISIYLIAFALPCAAQMGLNMSILGRMGASAFMIVFFFLLIVEAGAGLCLNKIIPKKAESDYLQELPPIRLPNLKAVFVKTYYRLVWFLKDAVPVFIYAALTLFTIDKIGLLDAIKNILSPVIEGFLGLPLSMVDALILCLARHEAAAGLIIRLIERGELNYIQSIVAVVITTMFVPCFANIIAMIKELGVKTAISMAVIINVSAFILAGFLNWGLILTIGHFM